MSATTVDLAGVQRLIAGGAQVVEVLPGEEYEELHLPGAISIPLKQLDADSVRQLDPDRDVVVYCWDALCDMSPRAAARLETLGFTRVHDYAAGKVDWLAHGLPAEGAYADRPTAASLARRDAATSALQSSAGEALRAIGNSPYGFALVLDGGGVLLGRVRRSALENIAGDAPIEPIMEAGPSTVRPDVTVEELRRRLQDSELQTLLVTRSDGTLVGVVRRSDVPE
jgi:rhodanese-related sulfurtransferase